MANNIFGKQRVIAILISLRCICLKGGAIAGEREVKYRRVTAEKRWNIVGHFGMEIQKTTDEKKKKITNLDRPPPQMGEGSVGKYTVLADAESEINGVNECQTVWGRGGAYLCTVLPQSYGYTVHEKDQHETNKNQNVSFFIIRHNYFF